MTSVEDLMTQREVRARAALHTLGLELADKWATGFKQNPTQQLVLQKLIDPIVKHVLNSAFPWIIGMAVLFLILLLCTVITLVILLRSGAGAGIVVVSSGD